MLALVTGSTGFLGRHLVDRLLAGGERVRALARSPEKASTLAGSGAEVVYGDLTRPESLAAAVAGVDTVFHAAAMVTNWGPWEQFLATTVTGTENLLASSLAAGVTRFVHVSTIRVYDDRHCRRHRVVTEDAPHGERGFRHFGHYAHAKVLAEAAVWRYAPRLPVSVVRPAWIYGPGDESILPPMVRFLRAPGSRWPGRADPSRTRSTSPTWRTARSPRRGTRRRSGRRTTWRPSGRSACASSWARFAPSWGSRRRGGRCPTRSRRWQRVSEWVAKARGRRTAPKVSRAGLAIMTQDVRHDPAKASRELGWQSRVSLADGVRATAAWLRARDSNRSEPTTTRL